MAIFEGRVAVFQRPSGSYCVAEWLLSTFRTGKDCICCSSTSRCEVWFNLFPTDRKGVDLSLRVSTSSSEKCSSVQAVLRVVLRVVIVAIVVRIVAFVVRIRRPACADASRCY